MRQGGGSRGRMSEASRKLISIAKSGCNNHMWGKHHTDEAKFKIGQGNTGKIRDATYRLKMSQAKGRNEMSKNLPMYVYNYKQKNNTGYCIKYHPNMKQTKISITTSTMNMDEKLNYILDCLNKLNLDK